MPLAFRRPKAPIASFAAAPGTTTLRTAAPLTGTGTSRATTGTTRAFAWPQLTRPAAAGRLTRSLKFRCIFAAEDTRSPGTGDPKDKHGFSDEKPQHEVLLTSGYWLGETPVTQAQWEAVTGENPSYFKGEDLPVEQVSWQDSRDFAEKLNAHFPGLHAALPTEAQWEYACRAGTESAFNDGSACTVPDGQDPALGKLGWFDKNSESKTHEVKQKNANAWGLYDMHGNVWEWCGDVWDEKAYEKRAEGVVNPFLDSKDKSAIRVVRGGSWFILAQNCRSAYRCRIEPGNLWLNQGFRLAAGQEPKAAEPQGAERP